jgi:hypothetical protein
MEGVLRIRRATVIAGAAWAQGTGAETTLRVSVGSIMKMLDQPAT